MKFEHRGIKYISLSILVVIFISFGISDLFATPSHDKRVRVGLIEPGALLSSCDLSFESPHAIYYHNRSDSSVSLPLAEFNSPANYKVAREYGLCEVSIKSYSSWNEVDLNNYPNSVPIIKDDRLYLLNTKTAFSNADKQWLESELVELETVTFREAGQVKFAISSAYALVKNQNGQVFSFYNSPYRGGFSVFVPTGSSDFFPINDIYLEDYLYGVVPREMPASWEIEALKAQAICARTYALASGGKYKNMSYDLAPTVSSQVYGGYAAESITSNQAVDETRGKQLFYGTHRVQTFYHSSNGGFCAASEDVFSEKLPYFNPKVDPYNLEIAEPWVVRINLEDLSKKLISNGLGVGKVIKLQVSKNSPSRRVSKVKIFGDEGGVEISGSKLRFLIGLKSTYFTITDENGASNISLLDFGVDKNKEVDKSENPFVKTEKNYIRVLTKNGVEKLELSNARVVNKTGQILSVNHNFMVLKSSHVSPINIISGRNTQSGYSDNLKTGGDIDKISESKVDDGSQNKTVLNSDGGAVVVGYGYGHGLGLSQWGAKVMAEKGMNVGEILTFYYEGTEIR